MGGHLDFHTTCGHDFPEDLASYQLVIHRGGCIQNRREMLTRIARCQAAGVPITNYGLTIATTLGILERGLSPFPVVLEHLARARKALVPKAMAFPAACAAPSLSLSR